MAGYPVQDASKKALAEELFSEVIDYSFANNKYWASTADEWIKIWISDNDNKYHIFEIQYIPFDKELEACLLITMYCL